MTSDVTERFTHRFVPRKQISARTKSEFWCLNVQASSLTCVKIHILDILRIMRWRINPIIRVESQIRGISRQERSVHFKMSVNPVRLNTFS